MTSRERVINCIERRHIDRIPRCDGFWDNPIEKFQKEGMPALPSMPMLDADGIQKPVGNPVSDFFNFDFDYMYVVLSMRFEPLVLEEDDEQMVVRDNFGWTARRFKNQSCSMLFLDHVTKTKEDWEKLKSRMTLNTADLSRLDSESYFQHTKPYPTHKGAKAIYDELRKRGKYLLFTAYGPYECTWRHHGYEESLMDIALEPEWMLDMMSTAVDLTIDTVRHAILLGMKPDGLYIVEDLGGTHTTLFSPKTYRELVKPLLKKLADFAHQNGLHIFMHSCGKIEPLIPDFIEAGLDVLQAIQASTGMTLLELKPRFGDKLTFWGNISEIAFRDGAEAIEKELRLKVPVAMKGGGFMYYSDHSIPPEVDWKTYSHAMKVLDEIGSY